MIEAFYKIGELFLGKKFLQGNSFIDFIRDGFRLFILMFSPWILLVIGATIMNLLEML
jgi:hypothetical protein